MLDDPEGDRSLRVELWYPAVAGARDAAASGQALVEFVPDQADAASLAALVETALGECVRKHSKSAAQPELADVDGPLAHDRVLALPRLRSLLLVHLNRAAASHGFLVAAVDHAGSTSFDEMAGELPPLDGATLELRRDDVVRVIDELLDPAAASLPGEFVGLDDPDRLGMFGHSFGAVTTGKVLQDDPRPRAGVAVAAPIENPLIPGVTMAGIDEPLALFVAVEDNSITEFGNSAIRTSFMQAHTPVWKLEFADTGHFGFSNLAGLSEYFAAGCGEGERQTNKEPFTYADPFAVRSLAAGRITAFFALHLRGDEDAREQLEGADPLLEVDVRE